MFVVVVRPTKTLGDTFLKLRAKQIAMVEPFMSCSPRPLIAGNHIAGRNQLNKTVWKNKFGNDGAFCGQNLPGNRDGFFGFGLHDIPKMGFANGNSWRE